MRRYMRHVLGSALLLALCVVPAPAVAQGAEYRAFWVDTFNTALNNPADVLAVVNNAKAANTNALFVQVRRRGDAWYLNSMEPLPDPNTIQPGFDPLADLITKAHAEGLEVHAFVIIGAIWNRHPVVLGPPASPDHVFNRHGGFDPATGRIVPGPDNWLTRTLLPDGGGITFQGHRFGNDFWIEPGHPDAAAYTVNVLMHLIRHYDVDGLHLDRIRYPEFTATGQTPTNGTNIGYNDTNVARFNWRHGLDPAGPPPAPGNPLWMQWRRDQVTNLVRRIYLNAIAVKPQLKVSAALIAFGGGPVAESSWPTASEAHWRVYQDWRSWTEEGIIDLAIPMNYKREHIAGQQTQFNQWLEWTRNHQYGRTALMGQGSFVNGIEGTLRQVRRSLEPSSTTGKKLDGVVFFSMATSNVYTNAGTAPPVATPYSIPPNQQTPTRSFAEFASGLTTGKSVDGTTLYEDPIANPVPVFGFTVPVPTHPWKNDPLTGHLKGFARDGSGHGFDTAAVALQRIAGSAVSSRIQWTTATDGGGFYGAVDLAAGLYRLMVTPVGGTSLTRCVAVPAAGVTDFDIASVPDDQQPAATIGSAVPAILWRPNDAEVNVTVSGTASDTGLGVAAVSFRVIDEYGDVEPTIALEFASGQSSLEWTRIVPLRASRREEDRNGRTYTIEATVTDRACQTTVVSTTVVVPHDRRVSR